MNPLSDIGENSLGSAQPELSSSIDPIKNRENCIVKRARAKPTPTCVNCKLDLSSDSTDASLSFNLRSGQHNYGLNNWRATGRNKLDRTQIEFDSSLKLADLTSGTNLLIKKQEENKVK